MKGKEKGSYVLLAGAVLSLVAAAAYLVFGLMSQTFVGNIFLVFLVAAACGCLLFFYNGFFADYLPAVISALSACGLILLGKDSVNDLTAFFVGMGDYFGNADNVGPRAAIFVIMLVSLLVVIIGSFMKNGKKAEA